MSILREEFEKLPEIADRIKKYTMGFCNKGNIYYSHGGSYISVAYVNGAWCTFQEQQKKIDDARKEINDFFDNQTMTPSDREYANKLADVLEILK